MPDKPILFYDSDCGFCDSAVRFVLNREQEPALCFAPLDGETARKLGIDGWVARRSVLLLENGAIYQRSSAVRRVLYRMGGRWRRLSRLMGLVPPVLADAVYGLVARWRRVLPRLPDCPVPSPEQRRRFLP